jgi:hypothetical protein
VFDLQSFATGVSVGALVGGACVSYLLGRRPGNGEVPPTGAAPVQDSFRVRGVFGPNYATVQLDTVMGPVLKVKAGSYGPYGTCCIDQVHPDDRVRVEDVVKAHPGSRERLSFNPFFDPRAQPGPPLPGDRP